MNENKKHCCKKHKQQEIKQVQENTKELNKMEEVISVEAGQNPEIIKENKETQNKN